MAAPPQITAGGKGRIFDKRMLYMCFKERMHDKSVALIQAINLRDLLIDTEVKYEVPRRVGYRQLKREDDGDALGCGVFGSRIVFAGGEVGKKEPNKLYFFETNPRKDPNPEIKIIESGLRSGKIEPFVLRMDDRKLYILGRVPTGESGPNFEAFDTITRQWDAMPEPPYGQIGQYFCPATDGTSIFLLGQKPKAYMCRFALSEKIWKTYAGDLCLPFTIGPPALVVEEKILLTYEFPPRGVDPPLFIGAYLMSSKDDDDPILCRLNSLEFRHGVPSEFRGSHYQLVHLLDRHICLLLYSYSPRIPGHQSVSHQADYMKICAIHLEYEYDPKESSFQLYRRGPPRILKYKYDYGLPKKHVCMIGAYALQW